ncbi:MAG: cation:proton antiporter [Candidatus Omnitrophota bacterium]
MIHFNTILTFGVILIFGYLAGWIANLLKLPKITGYIAAGIFLEPSFLGILPKGFIQNSDAISNFALCIITYVIGGSLHFERIKKMGKTMFWMTLLEAETAFLLVFGGLLVVFLAAGRYLGVSIQPTYYLPLALLSGALASPTDPTATIAVKEEYKADGPVTTTILGIAAFDDATGIVNFSIATAICVAVLGGAGSNIGTFVHPVVVILGSMLMGVLFAFLLLWVARKVKEKGVLVVLIFGFLFLCFGTAKLLNMDELLSTMVLGCVVANSGKYGEKFFISIREYIEETIFVIFFVLAGAHLEIGVLKSCLWIVLVFVIFRTLGKVLGVYFGGLISGAKGNVKRYTAFGLIPQGGIVVGLALLVKQDPRFSDISTILLNIVLGTTVFHEFIGPLFAEIGLKKANEVGKEKS